MNQIWNIFRKDARHHWPEIVASLALLAAFAWLDIHTWGLPNEVVAAGAFSFVLLFRILPGLVNVLLPLSWIFLIVRVVQGESLVGDRQFWVTRPYDWRLLLAAKTLFVVAFVNLPLFCMDMFLLAQAGFHPTHYLVGLLCMQLMWTLLMFLPAAAVASITRNIPQLLLGALLIALYMVGMAALSQVVPNSSFSGNGDESSGLLLIATAAAVVFVQYSRRRTALARWLIAGLCVALILVLLLTPYRSLIASEYPASKGDFPLQLALSSAENNKSNYFPGHYGVASITLPLSVSGIPKDSFLELDGMIVTLTNSAGLRWDSGWQFQARYLGTDVSVVEANFDMKQKIFDQFKSAPVNVHLLLAFTQYHDKNQRQFIVPSGEFNLPEVGRCSSKMEYGHALGCQVPLRRPTPLLITSETSASTCPITRVDTKPTPGHFARSISFGESEPAEMGISPVHQFDLYLSAWDWASHEPMSPGICPGTPLILSNPELIGRSRVELQHDNLSPTEYQQGSGKTIQ